MVLDGVCRQNPLVPMRRHEVAQHEIVTVVSSDGAEAPCSIQAVTAHNHGRPKSKGQALEHLSHEHTRRHLHRHTYCFEVRPKTSVFPPRQSHPTPKTP